MHSVTLISTRHDNLGICNSDELYRIIERINPQVIFEEIPPSLFDEFYVNKSRSNLETVAISKYTHINKIKHIPIDSDNIPSGKFFKDHQRMIQRIEGLANINGFTFRNLVDRNKQYIERFGFRYLNSEDSINMNKEIDGAIKNALQKIGNERLLEVFNLWNSTNEMRENHMLKNIYSYSKKHSYKRAIFTLGAAHRGSVIERISIFQKKEKLKLNWLF